MPAPAPSEPSDLPGDLGSASYPTPPGVAGSSRSVRVLLHVTSPSVRPDDLLEMSPGFTFSFLKKNSVTTGNGIPAEISRFSGNFDRKEFSNSKFRNFGIPAGFSVHLAGFSVLFTEK